MAKHYYVYILTNPAYTTLYVGMTNDIERRVYEHQP
jgi:putative endonuclease